MSAPSCDDFSVDCVELIKKAKYRFTAVERACQRTLSQTKSNLGDKGGEYLQDTQLEVQGGRMPGHGFAKLVQLFLI